MCGQEMRVSAYHDGELPAGEVALLEAHLASCGDCAAELARLRGLSAAIAGWGERVAMPEAMVERMSDAVRDARDESLVLPFVRRLTGLAAAVLLAGTVWVASQGGEAVAQPTAMAPAPTAQWEVTAVTLNADSSPEMVLAAYVAEPGSGRGGY